MKNTKDIESHLFYSEKLTGITAGHLQETAQLLENTEQLQEDVRVLLYENEALRSENRQKDEYIAKLEQRVAALEARPQYQVEQYVERQTIQKQIVALKSPKKRKKEISNSNQLDLWPNIALSM